MPTPHKHCQIIKAWAEGIQIQIQHQNGNWIDLNMPNPYWDITNNYRIKPEPIIIHGFIDPLMLEDTKNPYAVFRPNKLTSNDIPCTLNILPDA